LAGFSFASLPLPPASFDGGDRQSDGRNGAGGLHFDPLTVLAVVFSFYFVLAFMIWIVRGPAPKQAGAACAIDKNGRLQVRGLSTRQIIVWGIIGMFVMPALIAISTFTKQNYFIGNLAEILTANSEVSSGFIWLISLSTVVMIPVMIIWLVWMWLAWSKRDVSNPDPEPWSYEYE
jgi:hypothetical protein